MTFEEARKELKRLGEAHYKRPCFTSISYELTDFASGKPEVECSLYLEGYKHFVAPTWQGAFDLMKTELGLSNPDLTEAPNETLEEKALDTREFRETDNPPFSGIR
jgi:hypothetical protein